MRETTKSIQQAKYSDYMLYLFDPQRRFGIFLGSWVHSLTPADDLQDDSSSEIIAIAIMHTHERLHVRISELLL